MPKIVDRKGSSERDPDLDRIQSHIMATEAPQYKVYRVQLLHKVRTNTSVLLGISSEQIEIEPLQVGAHKFWVSYLLYNILFLFRKSIVITFLL